MAELSDCMVVKVVSCKGKCLTASEDRKSVTLQKERSETSKTTFLRNPQSWRVIGSEKGGGGRCQLWNTYDKVLDVEWDDLTACQKHHTLRPCTLGWAIEQPKKLVACSSAAVVLLKAKHNGHDYCLGAHDDGSLGVWKEDAMDPSDPCFHWTLRCEVAMDMPSLPAHHIESPTNVAVTKCTICGELSVPEAERSFSLNTGHNHNFMGIQSIGGVDLRYEICNNCFIL